MVMPPPSLEYPVFSTALCWTLLRMAGVADTALDDTEILQEFHAELGPGLAANYWFGYLNILINSNKVPSPCIDG